MKKSSIIFVFYSISLNLFAQPNCETYKNDEYCYAACQLAMKAIRYKQGSYQSQKHFDEAIELCPDFAYPYMEKAVPYLKRGMFIKWKEMIDKAVELSPEYYLGYRGWCRFQFLRDYDGAIKDIEKLESLINYDIEYCQTGDYHLNIVLAICYKKAGNPEKARELFQQQLSKGNYHPGLFDYYHFGVFEYEEGDFQKALEYFKKQIEINDYLGETYYFMAMACKEIGELEEYNQNLNKAEEYYRDEKFRKDKYTEPMDKIYLIDIMEEKEKSSYN